MNTKIRKQSVNSGVVFGIVYLFSVLIGFNTILGGLLLKPFGIKVSSTQPDIPEVIAFIVLIGLWAGISAARSQREESAKVRLLSSVITGVVIGLFSAVTVAIFQLLLANKINVRDYLVVLSFPFMRACSFKLPALAAVAANLGAFVVTAVAGGLLVDLWNLTAVAKARAKTATTVKGWVTSLRSGSSLKKKITTIIFYAAIFGLIVLLPMKWGSYWNYVFGIVGLYVILGLGLNIIVGLSGQLVLGYIAFFAIGAYTMALLNAPFPHDLMWGFWPALVLAVIAAAITGLILGLPIMRLRGDYLAIVTLGFGEIIRILLKSDLLTSFTGGPRGIQNIQGPTLFGRAFTDVDYMYLIVLAVCLSMYVYNRLQHSRTGRAWLAVREDETVARATGVNTARSKLLALMIGAAFAGLAGAIYAARNQFTGPDEHSLMASINVLCLIIVGGMGNIPGALLGAFALKGLPELLREVESYRMLAFGALLVVMMLSRPDGLIPSRRPTLELPEEEPAAADTGGTPAGEKPPAEEKHG